MIAELAAQVDSHASEAILTAAALIVSSLLQLVRRDHGELRNDVRAIARHLGVTLPSEEPKR